ncbi:amino acid/auxin permease-like protein [Phytophthora infestans T30-4]|uniref:Amino acid/auxin permease-like protein n=1 Tax=Phytophthora infestans (strain T30-4) TaxID=403677 RepID=D0NBY2_PHYIT|nr:amino acid/auxin permease-like protein [Phytophthora infestans T30-4]EEY55496.1 amino acid/auxin permease-like protein [Phytophthora infestans T30-4]|eukprot:XP_002903072.1 amino acid/auxin permease-like protein [Phytophthora infestans T30-4]
MQLHITTAFSVLINPAFYMAEFVNLGMHRQRKSTDVENGLEYAESTTPADEIMKQANVVADHKCHCTCHGETDAETTEYRGANAIKYIVLRTCITVILVVLSILFKDHFSDFADFVGSSSLTMSCILLPVAFYLIKAWNNIPKVEKIAAIVVFVVCLVFGLLDVHGWQEPLEYQNTVFYNSTAEHET